MYVPCLLHLANQADIQSFRLVLSIPLHGSPSGMLYTPLLCIYASNTLDLPVPVIRLPLISYTPQSDCILIALHRSR